jgi:drug/metabolite transporter (DMT)-like permease
MVVVFALASAALYAVASVLQQRAAAVAPAEHSLRIGLLAHLVARPMWLVGIAADAAGYVCQFVALDRGSLVLVQPLLVCGLLFALPLGAALSHQRLQAVDWTGTILIVSGLSLFLAVARPDHGHPEISGTAWALLFVCTMVPVGALVVAAQGDKRAQRAGLLAAGAGVLYGLTAALTKTAAHLLDIGVGHLLTSWEAYALVACGVLGMLLAQSAFQAGTLGASLPTLTIVDPVVSIVIGAAAFGEGLPVRGASPYLQGLGLLVMASGVVVLARSPLVTGPGPHVAVER